jgi:hypothetical protein
MRVKVGNFVSFAPGRIEPMKTTLAILALAASSGAAHAKEIAIPGNVALELSRG